MTTEALKKLENDLWSAADTLRANSGLKASSYSTPVLGLIFLKFADNKYSLYEKAIEAEFTKRQGTRKERPIEDVALEQCGFYLPPEARYSYLLGLPESKDLAAAIKTAMKKVEEYKPELAETLPKNEYAQLNRVKQGVRSAIDNLLDGELPESYDTELFKMKTQRIYDLVEDYAPAPYPVPPDLPLTST